MYNTIICAIVVVMLASTVVVAKPRNHQSNGQTREQYCRQVVGPEKGEGEAGKTATMRSQIMRWDDCMMQRSEPLISDSSVAGNAASPILWRVLINNRDW